MTHTPAHRGLWKPIVLIAILAGLFFAAWWYNLGEQLGEAQRWIASLGPWGPGAFIALYIVATIAMVPGVALTAIAGAVFGGLWGSVYVSIGSTIGAAACFLIARSFARDAVAGWLAGKPAFIRLDTMTQTHGGWIVAVTRLVPLFPFNLLNYGFGLTRVGFWTYAMLSWLCMIPGTVLYVVGFDAIATGLREGRVPWTVVAIVAGALVLLIVLTWIARRSLRRGGEESQT